MKPGIYQTKKELLGVIALTAVSFLILLAVLFAATARAERLINISLVVVEHATSAPVADQIRLFQEGISRLPEVKVKPRIIKTEIVPDFYNVNTLNELYSRLWIWAEYGKKQRFKGIVFYSLPPMTNGAGSFYSAGRAGAICVFTRNKKLKFAEGVLMNNSGRFDRQPHARVVALHEMLHLMGAMHTGDSGIPAEVVPNVMHPAAQAYATIPNLPILDLTKKQVRWCKQGKNVLGKRYI